MKYTLHLLVVALIFCTTNPYDKTVVDPKNNDLNKSGYSFQVNISKVNSKFSEIASTVFRDKLVIVSSKKIGGLGSGLNPVTKEPYTDLFCLDVKQNGSFSQPLLFSRILNTKSNEGQVAFSPDEHRIYYTRSERKNILNYKLYTAELKKDSYGKWINEMEVSISSDNHSIENPHVTSDGKFLYFSSDMKDGYGGFDLYKAEIHEDGSIGKPENLGGKINTSKDDKYPYTTKDSKEIYFSSKGHNSIGGFDIFISNINNKKYTEPRNLGYDINSKKDDVAFIIINGNQGVFSSNKDNANNSFNMYHFQSEIMYHELEGIVITQDDKILPNATVVLYNGEGLEIGRQTTNEDASYNFKIKPYQDYQLKVIKRGFKDYNKTLLSDGTPLKAILKLSSKISYNKSKP
ncbi:OmpA family protein [Flavobacteriales bacterium ALC-1]|nr:OmpA family protein [Flavobacteriales bacterium ALC-1]